MNDTLSSTAGSALTNLQSAVNQTNVLAQAEDQIKNATRTFLETLDEVINASHSIQNTTNDYIEIGAKYDEEYRQQYMLYFCAMIRINYKLKIHLY